MKLLVRVLLVVFLISTYQYAIAANDCKVEADSKEFLYKYFGSDNYSILKNELKLKSANLFFAVRYIDAKRKIFDRGLGFSIVNENVIPRIYFEKNNVLNEDRKSIFSVTNVQYKYYGWVFEWPKKVSELTDYFYLSYWREGGKFTADSMEFDWNIKRKKFEIRNYEDGK